MFQPYLGLGIQWVGRAGYLLESLLVSRACGSVEQLVGEEIDAVVL